VPDIRYAKSGGASIAYEVVGEADVDLVYVPEFVSNLVYGWETPYLREFYERFARSFRLIRFDKRGTGLRRLRDEWGTQEWCDARSFGGLHPRSQIATTCERGSQTGCASARARQSHTR